jgi:lipoprotein-releasing system ATP-binding protein
MMVLEAVDLAKVYRGEDGGTITVLDGVNLSVVRGEIVAVVGASGAGKSTLLHLLGALDLPSRGSVSLAGHSVVGRSDDELSELRNRSVGFVFQFHHLLREFTAVENVMMPLLIAGWDDAKARRRAEELLVRVGLATRLTHKPSALSGGEQQRTAVARALAIDPVVLLADEPSGNLDHANSERLHDLFVELSRDLEIAMVIATHNQTLAARADRTMLLDNGRLIDVTVPAPVDVAVEIRLSNDVNGAADAVTSDGIAAPEGVD